LKNSVKRKPPILIVFLLLIGIALVTLSVFLFTRLDLIVHGDLYRYGLQFNYEWAEYYWTYSSLMRDSLAIAIIAAGFSIVLVVVQARTRVSYYKFLSCALLAFGTFMIGFAAFFFNRLDLVVHGDLYRYGLQFSYEWAEQYWTYSRLLLGLLGMTLALNSAVAIVILIGDRIHFSKRAWLPEESFVYGF